MVSMQMVSEHIVCTHLTLKVLIFENTTFKAPMRIKARTSRKRERNVYPRHQLEAKGKKEIPNFLKIFHFLEKCVRDCGLLTLASPWESIENMLGIF